MNPKSVFDWLGRQSLDFYIPSLKIGIECQGLQHFKPIIYSSKNLVNNDYYDFNRIVQRDIGKSELCKANGIKMLYLFCSKNVEIPKELSNVYTTENVFYDSQSLLSAIKSGSIKISMNEIINILKETIAEYYEKRKE